LVGGGFLHYRLGLKVPERVLLGGLNTILVDDRFWEYLLFLYDAFDSFCLLRDVYHFPFAVHTRLMYLCRLLSVRFSALEEFNWFHGEFELLCTLCVGHQPRSLEPTTRGIIIATYFLRASKYTSACLSMGGICL